MIDNKKLSQAIRAIKKSFDNWDIDKAIQVTNDETQTRSNLINPLFDILGYDQYNDYTHEFSADIEGRKLRKVDMAITLGKKNPIVLIECKKATTRLTHQNFRQLDEYCFRTPSAKIGVLTNGIVYQFFTKTQTNALEVNPFFTFNLKEHSGGDIEMLALFQRQLIDTKIITERASEIYFFDRFDDALYESLKMPNNIKELTPSNKSFLEIIFRNMGGKRFTDSALEQIHPLVNAISLKSALDRVIKEENINSNTGIITTSEEIKFYNIVKTILGLSPKTKKQLDRVGYRDFKNFFGIVLDDNQRKGICYLRIDKTKKTISFSSDPNSYEIKNISVEEITKYKSQIIQSFLKNLD
jgi:hypothetical protein